MGRLGVFIAAEKTGPGDQSARLWEGYIGIDDIGPKGWQFKFKEWRGAAPVIDLVGCAVLLAVFGWYLISAMALPSPLNETDIGAGGFPRLLAIGTLIAILAVAVSAVIRLMDSLPVSWVSIRRPVFVIIAAALMVVEAIWFEALGTMVCVVVFAFAMMLVCGERRPLHLICVPLALAAFIYGVFVLALQVNLP